MEQNGTIVLFQEKQVRRLWHDEGWYFSIIDVIEILTDSPIPRTYWSKLKTRLLKESGETYRNWVQLKMLAADNKDRLTDCANREALLRIIMSIASPKAEPFKLWLAQVGEERIQEIEDPELAIERAKEIYKAKGYSEDWIERRLKSIDIRKQLTDEWQNRGVKEGQEYSILTAEISKATFGLTPAEYKKKKGLDRQNLRDHMTNLELIFTMLGEEATRTIAVKDDAQGFVENRDAALDGGKIAAKARQNLEKRTGESVISSENFLNLGNDHAKIDDLPSE